MKCISEHFLNTEDVDWLKWKWGLGLEMFIRQQQWTEPESEILPSLQQNQKTLPSLNDHTATKIRALVLKGMRGSEGIEQVTGSTRHKTAKDAVGRPSPLTPGQFHSSRSKHWDTKLKKKQLHSKKSQRFKTVGTEVNYNSQKTLQQDTSNQRVVVSTSQNFESIHFLISWWTFDSNLLQSDCRRGSWVL